MGGAPGLWKMFRSIIESGSILAGEPAVPRVTPSHASRNSREDPAESQLENAIEIGACKIAVCKPNPQPPGKKSLASAARELILFAPDKLLPDQNTTYRFSTPQVQTTFVTTAWAEAFSTRSATGTAAPGSLAAAWQPTPVVLPHIRPPPEWGANNGSRSPCRAGTCPGRFPVFRAGRRRPTLHQYRCEMFLEAIAHNQLAQTRRAGGRENVGAGDDAAVRDVGGHVRLSVIYVVHYVLEIGAQCQASESFEGEALLHSGVEDDVAGAGDGVAR